VDWVIVLVSVVIGLVVWLNVFDYRRRAKMTPDERRVEDEETRAELQIW
jgi:hypothetical protein